MQRNIVMELPIETISEANTKEHWARKANRVKKQRADAFYYCRLKRGIIEVSPDATIKIKLVRLAPKKLDNDNLVSAFKAIRDGIADWLKVNDGSDKITWEYDQEPIKFTRSVRFYLLIDDPYYLP
jgi:hypothetical protein